MNKNYHFVMRTTDITVATCYHSVYKTSNENFCHIVYNISDSHYCATYSYFVTFQSFV